MGISDEEMELLEHKFVLKSDCDDYTRDNDRRLASGEVSFTELRKDLGMIKWCLGIIAVSAITGVANNLINLILK